MTLEERRTAANVELKEIGLWLVAESDRICAKLSERGLVKGLDGNHEAFKEMHKEFARRMRLVGEKYGLLPKEDAQ